MSRDENWDSLSREQQAERIQAHARTQGHDMSRDEARMAADHYARQRLAERETRDTERGREILGSGLMGRARGSHPLEEAGRGPQLRKAPERTRGRSR